MVWNLLESREAGQRPAEREDAITRAGATQAQAQAFDEMSAGDEATREPYRGLAEWLRHTPRETLAVKRHEADLIFRRLGITFAVYGEGGDIERLIPFDIIPRVGCA